MNNDDLNGLTNALLTAFLDRAASSEVGAICAEFGVIPGSKIFHKAADRAIEWIDNGEYDLLDDSNRDKLTQQGLSNLAKQHGAVLGKDYSKTCDGYVFSSELMAKITADMSPSDLEMLKSTGQIKTVSNDAYAMLEKHLGVPFFDSLLGVIAIRFKVLSDTETDRYIGTLIEGMGFANPFLEDGLFFNKVFKLLGDRFESIMSAGNSLTALPAAMRYNLSYES